MNNTSVVVSNKNTDEEEQEWVKSAMSNDTIAANLLLNLHQTQPRHHHMPPPLLLNWTVRQRRSNSIPNNKTNNTNRGSPSTPLSFTTSLSAGSCDDDFKPVSKTTTTRSKVNGDSEKTASKRSRKKKTLPELREEEKLLVKERRDLKRELTVLRMNLEKQKSTNERLKRIKLDLQPNSVEPLSLLSNDIKVQPSKASDKLALPDLNMPFDDPSADAICRVG